MVVCRARRLLQPVARPRVLLLAALLTAAGSLFTGCRSCAGDDEPGRAPSLQSSDSSRAGGTKAKARAHGRSAGCGKASAGTGTFEEHRVQLDGTLRTYHVRVPATYDPARAYPVIVRWHGTGGTGLSDGLAIESAAKDDAIVVAPDGRDGHWTFRSSAEDLALFDAMYNALTRAYCVDLGRVFAYGFSAGGSVASALSCLRAGQLRGIATIAAFNVPIPCDTPIAAWLLHDRDDEAVAVRHSEAARDRLLSRNGCSQRATPLGDGCRSYEGCLSGFPVVWCETRGLGHNIAGESAPARVWQFFSQLR